MMRVGTQKGKKSSSNSPITTSAYRQSPTSGLNRSTNRLNTPSPVFNSSYNMHSSNSHYNASKTQSNVTSNLSYNRQSASPIYGESKFTNSDYHKMSTAEKRISSSASPSFMERQSSPSLLEKQRMQSPSFLEKQRMQSPSLLEKQRIQSPSLLEKQRMHSPSFGSSEHLTTKKLSERRMYESSSPSFMKTQTEHHDYNNKTSIYDQESTYTNKMSSMRISDSRSPVFMDRSSPSLNYGGSRFDKHVTENKSYNSRSFDTSDGVDTTPLIKVSAMSDRATARRDSWDAIAKTRNILSHRSLESVANLADSQLDSELTHDSSHKYSEEHSSYVTRDQTYSQHGERVYQSQLQTTRPIGARGGGATAVKVQPVPDGVLGQPVEFESK